MKRLLKYILIVVAAFLTSIVLSVLYYMFFSIIVSTDVEKELMRENRLLSEKLPLVEKDLSMLRDEVEYLRYRDGLIYENIFKTGAPETEDFVRLMPSVKVLPAAAAVEDNWRAIYAALEGDGDVPPLLSPVENMDYTAVGASVGEKLSPFYKVKTYHDGVDIVAPYGTPVHAAAGGHVSDIRFTLGGKGKMVELTHGGGYQTRYAHLSSINVKIGQTVKAGAVIGTVGDSGRAFTTHLHYEISRFGVVKDPLNYISAATSPDDCLHIMVMGASSGQSLD